MGDSKPYLRVFTFAGVLILVSGLVLGLFQEARAVDMGYAKTPSSAFRSDQNFNIDITIPQGQRIPIEEIEAVVEQQASGRSDKVNADVVARRACTTLGQPDTGCADSSSGNSSLSSFDSGSGTTAAIERIELINIFQGDPANLNTIGYGYVFGQGTLSGTTTGYGYDTVSSVYSSNGYGYGYGYELGSSSSFSAGTGYGYGYSNDDITLRFQVEIDGSQLQTSPSTTHYLTVLADTGSGVTGTLSSPFTTFEISTGGGGGPGGGGDGGDGGTEPIDSGVGDPVSPEEGQEVQLTRNLPAGVTKASVTFSQSCTDCTVHISRSTAPPQGSPGTPAGFSAVSFMTIEVRDADGNVLDGYVQDATVEFEVSQSDLPGNAQPKQIVLLRDANGWRPQDTQLVSDPTADPLVYESTLEGFSNFAITADETPPEITDTLPTGDVAKGTIELGASWSDNRGIDADTFRLLVDGNRQPSATGDADGFTFDVTVLDLGEHTATAMINDTSGLQTEESWSFNVVEVDVTNCDETGLPRITSVTPEDGAADVTPGTRLIVNFEDEADCPVDSATLTIDGETVDVIPGGDRVTTLLTADQLTAGEMTTASVTITDHGDKSDSREWSFQQADEVGDDDDDDDGEGNALLFVIIALVLLAIVGVGAYFYTQQEGGPR